MAKLQDYVLGVHEEEFNQVIRQTSFFYSILVYKGKFDVSKDVYKGELIPIDNVPRLIQTNSINK